VLGDAEHREPDQHEWTPWSPRAARPDRVGAVRVYCLPHAGGTAEAYLPWVRSPGCPGLDVVPVELPGHGTRRGERLLASMEEVTDGLLGLLASRPPDEPFVLLGHSMGAHLVHETARRLAGTGRPQPLAVVVSGSRPAGPSDTHRLHALPDDVLLERLAHLGGTPAEVLGRRSLVRMLLPVLRADLNLVADYAARVRPTPVPCPLLALGGSEDRLADPAGVAAWASLTSGLFRHRTLPGGHFFLHAHRDRVMAEVALMARDAVPSV
jgi:medium-chain acyl-[acyl-carrier-protein] hydrolase